MEDARTRSSFLSTAANVLAMVLAVLMIVAVAPFALESIGLLSGAASRQVEPSHAQAEATPAPLFAQPQIVVRPITTRVEAQPVEPVVAPQPVAPAVVEPQPAPQAPEPAHVAPQPLIVEVVHHSGADPLPEPPAQPNVQRYIITQTDNGQQFVTGSAACLAPNRVARRCAP